MRRLLILNFALILLASCSRDCLTVQSQYIHADYLASVHVHTPDTRKENPKVGQRLLVKWTFPRAQFEKLAKNGLFLILQVRFGNHQEEMRKYPIEKSRGGIVYSLLDEQYFFKKGIVTYKADIISNEKVEESWRHQVWTDIIDVDFDD